MISKITTQIAVIARRACLWLAAELVAAAEWLDNHTQAQTPE